MSTAAIFACVKWVTLRPRIDPLDGSVEETSHDSWFSQADFAAVETALRVAETWTAAGVDLSVTAVCVGPPGAEEALRDLVAVGVDRIVRVDTGSGSDEHAQPSSAAVAALLEPVVDSSAAAAASQTLVVCGDMSTDRGSGSVPAFLAHDLGYAQALGLVQVDTPSVGELECVRRLDGGRREILRVEAPAVISVEGAVGDLRRASLSASLRARRAEVEVLEARVEAASPGRLRPWRPRTRVVAAPGPADAFHRIVELTGATTDRTPPQTIHLDPQEAARTILDQITEWGYEWGSDSQG